MKRAVFRCARYALATLLSLAYVTLADDASSELRLTEQDALETHGLSILLFHNSYHAVFGDQKMSGLEIILDDRRIATNGDVRLSAAPAQWDAIPQFKERKRGSLPNELIASLSYADRGLNYQVDVRPETGGIRVAVLLDHALPPSLSRKAGFNLEFLPTAFFGKSYIVDDAPGIFPRHPRGPMIKTAEGSFDPAALGSGHNITLSPEDPTTRVGITSEGAPLTLFDGRNQAPNGWFVVRSLLPSEKTGEVIVWHVQLKVAAGWTRPPVVGYNQVGYTPDRNKVAVVELDPQCQSPTTARVVRLSPDGTYKEAFHGEVKPWGKWLRYQYALFDFT